MHTVNIHEAKTHLSKLIEQVIKGEPFIIAKAGKPLVKVIALTEPTSKKTQRIGFLKGKIQAPDDFNEMGREEIQHLFEEGE